jgi:hypothetical protein
MHLKNRKQHSFVHVLYLVKAQVKLPKSHPSNSGTTILYNLLTMLWQIIHMISQFREEGTKSWQQRQIMARLFSHEVPHHSTLKKKE